VGARPIVLGAVTRTERHAALRSAGDAVRDAGGWIDDARFYSNLSAAVRCTVPAGGADGLRRGLAAAGIRLDAESEAALGAAADGGPPGRELACVVQISFVHDDPDLRHPVPSVPG
jgi:hypothetical protein